MNRCHTILGRMGMVKIKPDNIMNVPGAGFQRWGIDEDRQNVDR